MKNVTFGIVVFVFCLVMASCETLAPQDVGVAPSAAVPSANYIEIVPDVETVDVRTSADVEHSEKTEGEEKIENVIDEPLNDKSSNDENTYLIDILENVDNGFSLNKRDGIFIIASTNKSSDYELKAIENAMSEKLQSYGFSNVVFASQVRNFDPNKIDYVYPFALVNDCRYVLLIGFDSVTTFEYGGGLADSVGFVAVIDTFSGIFDYMENYDNESILDGEDKCAILTVATTAYNNFERYYPSWKTFSSVYADEVVCKLNEISLSYRNKDIDSAYIIMRYQLKEYSKNYIGNMN